ncbi:MAG TPA: glycosyltransferase family 4 protein [Chloroflexota bacterium]|nr:glycosyltransferase family 4 protein [Chloroflexota bacterium]
MKILLLTQVVPYPPDSGPKIKTYNVIRYLAQHHEIHLVSFSRSESETSAAEALRPYCKEITTIPLRRSSLKDAWFLGRSLISGRPFLIERDDSSVMRTAVETQLGRQSFDAVHADQLSMAQFAVGLPLALRVLDEHNAVWTIVHRAAKAGGFGLRRMLAEIEWRKLQAYEADICQRFDFTTVVSIDDFLAIAGPARAIFPARVIPIAVDSQEMAFEPRSAEARHIVSVATMFYPPNAEGVHWFACEVFPLIRQSIPNVQFYIIGARPPDKIVRLARTGNGVVVTGYLSDLAPTLRKAAVMVVPVHSGSGMRVKILESFSRGIPVVSTTVGAEGIDARNGQHLLVADSPSEIAEAVIRVLTDPLESTKLASAGRELVEAQYDWRTALCGLDELYPSSISGLPPVPTPADADGPNTLVQAPPR